MRVFCKEGNKARSRQDCNNTFQNISFGLPYLADMYDNTQNTRTEYAQQISFSVLTH